MTLPPPDRATLSAELAAIEREVRRRKEMALARDVLRSVAAFCASHDPAAVASVAEAIPETLASVARIELWLRAYTQAIRQRQPQ
jgi:hypothetical protein